ncbi:trypsin-like peptidase domain-containing protein [Streptomyces sp. NPDC056390]|uniref:VMAP-C domain-containing protein n=1 Tax=Streptomyces sp. NPDC056390 TaxID=3345806 RepID=UPI0035DCDFC0
MNSARWHARIECGRQIGAGFLVTGRKVLTCAHVIADSGAAPVTVTFPHGAGAVAVPARVVSHGGWGGRPTDPGDLAVLELDEDAPVDPAAFAPADAAFGEPPRKLVAYGFPRGYDEGTLAEYRATAAQLIGGEWIQLEAWNGHGQPLEAGFSGAAVALAGTGEVVGMVTATGGRGVRNGRMLPTHVMARYWPELGERLPTPAHEDADRDRLRVLVAKAARAGLDCSPQRLYLDAAGPFGPPVPPEGFDSLWAAAWYVLCELDDPESVTRFADRLDALLDAPRTGAAARHARPDWSPILVEIGRSGAGGDQVVVEVSAYSAGRRHPVDSRTLAHGELRPYVRERIDEAFSHLAPDTDELIAFALPREWLNWPVAQWESGPDDPTPLGCSYPLVVTDHARRRGGLRHRLTRRWQGIDTGANALVHRVECDSGEDPRKLRLRLRAADVAGFAAPPAAEHSRPRFDTALTKPVPVLLWPRSGCGGEHAGAWPDEAADKGDGGCAGSAFLDAIGPYVAGVTPAELPRHILSLRETADAADDPDGHWARDVQLLWDDPRCFPDPHTTTTHLHSPVA